MTEIFTASQPQVVDFDPFTGPALLYTVPTTGPQREIWTACQFSDAANRAYNESVSVRLSGPLDQAGLARAWQSVGVRHEALRSAFSADGEQMLFFAEIPSPLIVQDASQAADPEGFTNDLIKQDALFVFDLTNGPLVKATLIRQSDTVHLFVLTAHHIICDGWSVGILLQDLGAFYSAFVQGREPTLPPPDSFGQYAVEQQTFEKSTDYQQVERFWLDQFKQLPPTLALLTDAPHPTRRSYPSFRQDFQVETELVKAIRQTAATLGVSLVKMLVAAVEVWLHQLTGQTDLVLGLPAAGQPTTGHDRLVGHCVSLLPLRSEHRPGEPFADYVAQRKLELLDCLDNQQLTFGELLKKLPIRREPGRVPLVPVVFNVDIGLADGVAFSGLTVALISNPRAFENFDISLNATGSGDAMQLEWSYNAQLFRAETIRGFQKQLVAVLGGITTKTSNRVDPSEKLPLPNPSPSGRGLTPEAVKPLPDREGLGRGQDVALPDLLSQTARQFSGKIALRLGTKTITYGELDAQANRLARVLLAEGVRPGDRVGLALDRSIELIISLLAVMKTGAAYVPTDPRHPDDRINYVLTDAGCRLLLTQVAYQTRFPNDRPTLAVETVWPTLPTYPPDALTTTISSHDVVYVLYTSGTTGRPKGVLIRHQSVTNVLFSVAAQPGLGPDDKTISLATIAFDLATVEIYLPLLVGAELVLTDADTARDGQKLAALLQAERLTFMQATPATWRLLWETGWRGDKNLRLISCAEALPKDLADKLLSTCREVWNFYGPTETTIYATGKRIQATDAIISIGPAIANTRIFIVDENGQPTPQTDESTGTPDRPGEIWIGGEGVSEGYVNQPALTAEKFIDSPFANSISAKLYRTGDLGRFLPNGDVQYLGRIDAQIKLRGHRIEPGEIEQQLLRQTDISQAVVMAREDRPNDQRLVAYVVSKTLTINELTEQSAVPRWRLALQAVLPGYMIPTDFVILPTLPVTANGKTDRAALPAPKSASSSSDQPGFSLAKPARNVSGRPLTDLEQRLAAIWKSVFGLDTIRVDDDFFALGGHSMLAVQVMKQLERQTSKRLPMSLLFEYPTIRQLARMLDTEQPADTRKSLVPIRPQGRLTPVYIIHGGGLNLLNFKGLVENMNPEQPIYGLQARGLDGTEEPLDNMEAIAATYLEEVLAQNPTGPYALAGYSFGGYVAYEMARQLHAQGRTVKLLGMFDTNAQELVSNESAGRTVWKKIARQGPKLRWIMNSLIRRPGPAAQYQIEYVARKVNAALRLVGLGKPPKPDTEETHLNRLIEKHEVAYKNYALKPYAGALDLFRATDRLYFVDDFEYLGWKNYALGGVRVYDVPGDHETLMLPPNDKQLAQALQKALDNR